MAEVAWVSDRARHFTVTGLSASDTSLPIRMNAGAGVVLNVYALSGGGTGFNSGTLTCQISNDGTNWATAKDVQGTDVTYTAEGHFELNTAAQQIRMSCDGSIGDVDVYFNFG